MNRAQPVVVLAAAIATYAAAAQPTASESAQPVTSSAPLRYQSAFADYRPFQEVEVGPWKALNDQVRASAAARSMPATPGPQATPASPAPVPAPTPHVHQERKP